MADWFDPLGLRRRAFDPFRLFTEAVRGEGPSSQAAQRVATAVARGLVGRRVELDRDPPIEGTIDRVDEVSPATALGALPVGVAEVPVWRRIRGRMVGVTIGNHRIGTVVVDATDIRLLGTTGQRLWVARIELAASTPVVEVEGWIARSGDRRLRLHEGRIEVSDRRVVRWARVEVDVRVDAGRLRVTPSALWLLARRVPLPAPLRRPVERSVSWLPEELVVTDVRVEGDRLLATGHALAVSVPVDLARLLGEIGTGNARSVLRLAQGVSSPSSAFSARND